MQKKVYQYQKVLLGIGNCHWRGFLDKYTLIDISALQIKAENMHGIITKSTRLGHINSIQQIFKKL